MVLGGVTNEELTTRRQAQLHQAAVTEGGIWAEWWRDELTRQSRAVAGGWPGTISEARRRIATRIARDFGPRFGATASELEAATRSTYVVAKRHWNDCAVSDELP